MGEDELRGTGELYEQRYYRDTWPPVSLPRFRMYDGVRVSSPRPDNQNWKGREGFVYEPPVCYGRGDWNYSVMFCPDGDWSCPGSDVRGFWEDELSPTGRTSGRRQVHLGNPPQYADEERVLVRVDSTGAEADVVLRGTVRGSSQSEDGRWGYAVRVDGVSRVQYIGEERLSPIGEFDDTTF